MVFVWSVDKSQKAVNEERGPFRVFGGSVYEGCCVLDGGSNAGVFSPFAI